MISILLKLYTFIQWRYFENIVSWLHLRGDGDLLHDRTGSHRSRWSSGVAHQIFPFELPSLLFGNGAQSNDFPSRLLFILVGVDMKEIGVHRRLNHRWNDSWGGHCGSMTLTILISRRRGWRGDGLLKISAQIPLDTLGEFLRFLWLCIGFVVLASVLLKSTAPACASPQSVLLSQPHSIANLLELIRLSIPFHLQPIQIHGALHHRHEQVALKKGEDEQNRS